MAEPDPKPQIEDTTMANGSGPLKDSGAEAVPVTKQGVEELKVGKENNGSAEMKKEDGEHGVEEMKDGVGKEEDVKAKNSAGETKEGGEKNDVKEMNGSEETKEKKGENGIKEMNGVEETKGGEDKNSVNGTNNEKDTKEVEEKMVVEEKEGEEKIKDGEEKDSSAQKKDEEGKVDEVEAENVKEEDKMATDERVEDGGGKSEGKDDVKDKEDDMDMEKEGDGNKKVKGLKKKRSRSGRKVDEKGEAEEKKEETKKAGGSKEKKEGVKKPKEPLTSPRPSSIDRPVRERKTVERLVEVIQKETSKGVVIEKGRGTPLKDIPNVAHKLASKKPGDLKLLHQVFFGRRGKTIDFKNHVLQFSGFAWPESDEKQRAKLKERLDKYVKDALLDLCDLLDISVSKANTKKEDIIVKLLDFVVAPNATTDALFTEREQVYVRCENLIGFDDSPKSLKRKRVARGSASKGTEDVPKKSRMKRMKWEGILSSGEKAMPDTEDEDEKEEEEDNENVAPEEGEEDDELAHSVSDKENESKEASEKDEGEDVEDFRKDKQDKKSSLKKQNSAKKKKVNVEGSSKKTPSATAAKSSSKTPSSTRSKSDDRNDEGEKVFVQKKKQVDLSKKKSTSKSDVKEKSSGKRGAGDNPKLEGAEQSNPSKEDLRKTICEILKKADFNTATFMDILKQLATHYKVDLTPRKATIKLMIQEELTKLTDEAEVNKDDGDSEKEVHRKAEGKKVEV